MIRERCTLPNLLSFLRLPLALAFLVDSVWVRCGVVVLAAISDGLDGFLARRLGQTSQFGALLDPIMDRFFVFFIAFVCLSEGLVSYQELGAFACRDLAILLFSLYTLWKGSSSHYEFRSLWSGKVTTCCQFFVLAAIALGISIPKELFWLFVALGFAALIELSRMNYHVERRS